MKIEWTVRATLDLRAAYEYWAGARSPAAAEKMLDTIFSAVEILETYPAAGRRGRVAGIRELVILKTPFLIPYRVRRKSIQILALLHGARKWPERF
jgi:plasmid stabilization system protein ParE